MQVLIPRTLITGANRGIGAGLLAHYQTGHNAIGTSRNPTAGLLTLDVTDPASCEALAAQVPALDLLICNAGVYLDGAQDLEQGFAPDLWAQSFATNVTGTFLTIQALLPQLRASKGKIAIISSLMASHSRAPGGSYIYRASKAAVLNLGRNLATDLGSDGVAVGIYHPGWVQTDMGGPQATITVPQSVAGLTRCFDALSMQTTGCFLSYDGTELPY